MDGVDIELDHVDFFGSISHMGWDNSREVTYEGCGVVMSHIFL